MWQWLSVRVWGILEPQSEQLWNYLSNPQQVLGRIRGGYSFRVLGTDIQISALICPVAIRITPSFNDRARSILIYETELL